MAKRFTIKAHARRADLVIKVDDCDAYLLRSYPWSARAPGPRNVQYRVQRSLGAGAWKPLSHVICPPAVGERVVHMNGDSYDFTRDNLRALPEAAARAQASRQVWARDNPQSMSAAQHQGLQ